MMVNLRDFQVLLVSVSYKNVFVQYIKHSYTCKTPETLELFSAMCFSVGKPLKGIIQGEHNISIV